ncbi:hypothetical protein FPSE_08079 [Fusarium pseudograminearum CS3096]|uniref:Uncharacterized protein n=1 Tax=Fusarium pseudograminearum (strain CS3096) TaxID=1028729 RepID=K3VFN1_FUSPC|nr:hypothetical protein FPSE_08079 [Fusarium pseudograminearum CS3096]EKJ71633.1 hypothetical protein FPSE_08079 [Fusarium pseudograminearum CS3096]
MEEKTTFLAVVDRCDNFPRNDFQGQAAYAAAVSQLWRFLLPGDDRAFGILVSSTVAQMPWTSEFELDYAAQTVRMIPDSSVDIAPSSARAFERLLKAAQ